VKLVYEKTNEEVKIGDELRFLRCGDEIDAKVTYFRKPNSPASSGKVSIEYADGVTVEFYVGVIGARWIEREDRQ